MGMFSSSQIRIHEIPLWLFELGIWRELNTGKSFWTEVTYQKQVALLSVRMQQTNSQRSGIFATPDQCLHPLGLLELLWKLLVHRCETNYEAYAVAFLLIVGNKTNWRDGGLLKAIIVWLYFKKICLILKTPQFLEVSQPREVTLIIRLIYFNSLNQKYWLNEKLTRVELQMSFGFRFPEWYNY